MILLNMFDVQDPVILGLPQSDRQETVRKVKQLTGRMVGINLEPVDDAAASENAETLWAMSAGRYATVENAALAQKMGVDMIVLTGNPGNGVSNDAIVSSLRAISAEIGGQRLCLLPEKCTHRELSVKEEKISSQKRISASLPRQGQT